MSRGLVSQRQIKDGPLDLAPQVGKAKPAQYLCQIKEEVSAARFTGKGDELQVKRLLDQFEANVRTALHEAQRTNWEHKYKMIPRSHQWLKANAKARAQNSGFGGEAFGYYESDHMRLLFAAFVCDGVTGYQTPLPREITVPPPMSQHGAPFGTHGLRGVLGAGGSLVSSCAQSSLDEVEMAGPSYRASASHKV